MPKIIVASRYLKPASQGTRSNFVKYIATRETVQKYSPKKKDLPVTENQQQLIFELLKINLDGKKLPEYSDYLKSRHGKTLLNCAPSCLNKARI